MIRVDSVRKSFGATTVVDDVTIRLGTAGITSIIGPNGAGKSTLLSLIGRLAGVDAGTISIDGLDVFATRGSALATRVSVLRQDNALTARLTVRDLVEFGRYPHAKTRLGTGDVAHVERALRYLDLLDLQDRFLDELSGGQRQRAFIAMVLAQDTDYVLLDEPLNNLDLRHAAETMRLLRRAADDLGKRVVVVLHDLNFAAAFSDRMVAMRAGRVVAEGSTREVMRSEVLSPIYDHDIVVREVDGSLVALYFR